MAFRVLTWDPLQQRHLPKPSQKKFLAARIPWDWITTAAMLPGRALVVGLCLWRLSTTTKKLTVRLGSNDLKPMGIDRCAKSRALQALQGAGLVDIKGEPGRLPLVTIIVDNS